MKKSSTICFFEMIFLILVFMLNIFLFKITKVYAFSILLTVFVLINYFFTGYEKSNYRNKKDILLTIITNVIVYFLITYLLGILIGFVKNGYSLNLYDILKNVFPYLIFILIREIFRYFYFTKAKESKLLIVLGLVFFIILDVNLNIHIYDVKTTLGLTKMVCLIIFPSVSKNIFLSYITVKTGYENAIVYSLITELNKFILPIFPDFGEYIKTLIEAIFPLYLTINIANKFKFKEKRRITSSRYHSKNLLFYSIITFILLIIIMLTSGYFKYYALTIGSSSMHPNISKGDVVIIKKLKKNEHDKIKLKDVLVYKYEDRIIVHRLVETKNLNGKTFYITKGDNNLTKDAYYVSGSDIIGRVSFKIKYIGMPTVALNEKIDR